MAVTETSIEAYHSIKDGVLLKRAELLRHFYQQYGKLSDGEAAELLNCTPSSLTGARHALGAVHVGYAKSVRSNKTVRLWGLSATA